MKILHTNHLPSGIKAMMLFGLLFVRKGANMSSVDLNHEEIHFMQFKEVTFAAFMLSIIPGFLGMWWMILLSPVVFYACYGAEWLIRLIQLRDGHQAYRNISLEREAYENECDLTFLDYREPFTFVQYIK